MRTVKITAITSATAWAIGVAAFMSLLLKEPHTRISLNDFFSALLVYGAYVAGIVLPVGLFVVAPLVHFLDARSTAVHPAIAPLIGSFAGIAGTYLFASLAFSASHFEAPDFRATGIWIFIGIAALGGALSGLVCALQIRRNVA